MAAAKDQRSVTVHDVARHAGVSSMTVSRVINGASYVSAKAREKVLASVKALNYVPNLAARAARSGTFRLGMLYSNPSAAYLNAFLAGALEQCAKSGAQLVLERCTNTASQRAALKRLLDDGVDGVMLPPPMCDSRTAVRELDKINMPVVAIATARPMDGVGAVRINDYQGAWAMTDHLLSLGHRDIAFVNGDPRHTPAQLRLKGFLERMEKEGITVPPNRVLHGMFTYQSGLVAGDEIMRHAKRPTAIFAANDDMAAGLVSTAHKYDIDVPAELSICGFDDTPVALSIWPELTTMHQPIAAIARAAVNMLLEEIRLARNGQPRLASHEVLRFTLVKRASTAPPR